jgi:hypothetical protein
VDYERQVQMGVHPPVHREGRTCSGTDPATTSPFSSEISRWYQFRYPYANLHLWGVWRTGIILKPPPLSVR